MRTLPQEELKALLHYDPLSGIFTRRASISSNARAGDVAGTLSNATGYRSISIGNRKYLAHRLAWQYVFGETPINEIDHINGDRSDNRLANLRQATKSENQQNLALKRRKREGRLGTSRIKSSGRWRATIQIALVAKHLGVFDTEEEAHQVYLLAKTRLHKFSPSPRGTA